MLAGCHVLCELGFINEGSRLMSESIQTGFSVLNLMCQMAASCMMVPRACRKFILLVWLPPPISFGRVSLFLG
jgi:hypothetical protein